MDGGFPDISRPLRQGSRRAPQSGGSEYPPASRPPHLRPHRARDPARADVRAAAGRGGIYLVLGDLKEAVVLGIFACTSVLIAVVQESRTERVLESLRDLTSPRALVIRDGIEKRIAGTDVVRGDLVILAEGDRVPADATVLAAHDLQCDESLLTGEAVPVRKIASPGAPPARPGRR